SDEYAAGIYALPEAVRHGARVLIMPCFHVTPRLLEACSNVGWVHHPGAGVNSGPFWTDWEMLERRHVVVTTAKIHAIPISEMIVTFMLMLSKHMPRYHERQERRIYHNEEHLRAIIMDGRTALILGTGHVGSETARKLKLAFHMTTIGINSDGRPVLFFDETYTLAGLDSVLPRADYLICTSVLVEDTLGMINAKRIALMKPSAFVINPSRGGLLVEQDLIEALAAHRIAGAGLDTYEVEPLSEDSPLWGLDNVILTPHISGGRPDYNTAVMDRLLANLDAFSRGRVDRMTEVANTKRY
ncbi:MAG: D-2-hydroxyacid dehydrogenase, partial [Anaerolineae bacterium]|nr:D-2-hydroxyacid dehydrogenase [Anaerolineae bacterium]